jgi:hypothetical protein
VLESAFDRMLTPNFAGVGVELGRLSGGRRR